MSRPARHPDAVQRRAVRRWGILIGAAATLVVAVLLSIAIGSSLLSLRTVWQAFTDPDGSAAQMTVTSARMDRTLLGIAVGAALGVSGALIQGLTRNPLADPGVLGVNAGAGFAVVLAVAVLGITRIDQYLPFAFLGALAASAAVYLIASGGRGAPTPLRLTLVGVAGGSVLTGIAQTLTLIDVQMFDRMRYWGAGTIADRPAGTLVTIAPFIVIGLVLAAFGARGLNAMALGDDAAKALGAGVTTTRILVVAAVALLCGSATAAAGPIAFVGLMIPHVVRWGTGPDWRWILAISAVLGPAFMLLADVVGRLIVIPAELQVGVVTALVGAPVLVLLARGAKARSL